MESLDFKRIISWGDACLILTDREIKIAIERKQIEFEPAPDQEAFSSIAIDLTLDSEISEFKTHAEGLETIIDPSHPDFDFDKAFDELAEPITINDSDGYLLEKGGLVLGWTKEYINLKIPSRLAARIEGKSSLARLGLGIHLTAPTIHAGFEGQIRLEMINHGPIPIRLRTGMPVCQLIFETTLGTPDRGYAGRFIGQTS